MKRDDLQVYFITGTTNVKKCEPLLLLEKALKAGITMFQLREKGPDALTGEAYEQFARSCQKLCHQYNVPFIVNDDVDLAIKINADGVHIGQDDLPISIVREKIGQLLLGVSVHNDNELQEALHYKADYVGIGPIFETHSKKDANAPSGTHFLQKVTHQNPDLPVVAIGGITESNCHEVFHAGADGIAIISAICESENVSKTVQYFRNAKIRA